MQWFNNLKISLKLIMGFGTFSLLIAALGFFSIMRSEEVNGVVKIIEKNWLPAVSYISDMNTNTSDFRIAELHHIASVTPEERSIYEKDMVRVKNSFDQNDKNYTALLTNKTDEEKRAYDEFQQKWKAYLVEHEKILELSHENKDDEAKALLKGKSQQIFDDFSNKLLDIIKLNRQGGKEASERVDNIYDSSRTLIMLVTIASVILGIIIALFISSVISKPINETVEIAERLAKGELSAEMKVTSKDEFGRLAEAMNNMTDYLRNMAGTASSIAEGNLSKNVEPKSSRDVFGNAFKNMLDNLRTMANVADSIAKGNLTIQVNPQSSADSFGNTFKSMLDSLRTIIRELRENSQVLSSAAEELVAVSTNQSSVITEQASSIQEITSTLDEIRATVGQASDKAKSVAQVSEQSLEISKTGQQELEQVIKAIGKIKDQVETIAENILDLSEKTIQIGEITSSVNDIAEQSNLLAVNAAIEATKAGDAGKGFGVVAVEVKNLAARSKKATTQVRSILAEIQKAANSTVLVTEEGSKKAENGVEQVYRIGVNIKNLHEVILESFTAAKQIAYASTQQVTGIEQITIAMKQINQATNETVASAKQQKATAQNLSQLANSLNNIVQKYQL